MNLNSEFVINLTNCIDLTEFIVFARSGLVWGSSVKHQPQRVGIEHVLNDEDVVQIVKKV